MAPLRATRDGEPVEGVRTVLDGGEQVVGFADPEQVPRLVLREFLADPPTMVPRLCFSSAPPMP